jgi:excisionase family DNA binding protein
MSDRRKRELAESGFLKATEAARFLGISDVRVYQMRKAGLLSSAVIGGKIVFPRKALEEYAASRLTLGSVA